MDLSQPPSATDTVAEPSPDASHSCFTIYVCDGVRDADVPCTWRGTQYEMDEIDDIHDRVLAGEFMAAGQCPECGCLFSIQDQDIPNYTLEQAAAILRRRGWIIHKPTEADSHG